MCYFVTSLFNILSQLLLRLIEQAAKQGSPYDICTQKRIRDRDAKSVYEQTAPSCYSIQPKLHDKYQIITYFTPARYLILMVSQLMLFDRYLILVAQQLMLSDRQRPVF